MRVLFMGTPAFALPTLRALSAAHQVVAVVTRPDKRRGRGSVTSFSEVKAWAVEAGLPVEQPATLRDAQVQARLSSYAADVAVVAAYGLILPAEVLAAPRLGCVNVHASLLPRHRGAAPIAWAILSGDTETGVTIMQMDEGLDTGPMLLRRAIAIGARETAPQLAGRLAALGAELIGAALAGLESGVLGATPQPADGVTTAPSFRKADGALDWEQPGAAVDARVRALQPWPGSFTFSDSDRLTLWRVEPHAGEQVGDVAAGTVLAATGDAIRVACGAGEAVDVVELQRAGGRRQAAADFLRGRSVRVGERWGPGPR